MSEMVDEIESLRALDRDALIARYRAETGREPRQKNAAWLVRRLAWRVQERRLGGLSAAARARLDELVAQIDLRVEAPRSTGQLSRSPKRTDGLAVGTCVEREYRGERLLLRVEEGGFRVEGSSRIDPDVIHRSISAAAAAACGQHVNGNLWWRLVSRKRAS